ncbi:uncharacterized protein L3040_009589 [Drepanopeziza brunnea f. sp. 'multigermtubi']|uniref:uncharacterized protein n=1 Tax=Drepanopeziza brunnea f. sp. 'multigermtubi' TaxID=698441 RepID=UPI00238B9A58|nr:hypothetical protein L3040_009589 [Drepanopeziza brunnea f. sp. 'multigermtubi']
MDDVCAAADSLTDWSQWSGFGASGDRTGSVEARDHTEGREKPKRPCRQQFRRPRAGRACGSCHSRRIRCDAGSLGLPCTNCTANSVDCFIPPKKRKSIAPSDMIRQRHRSSYERSKADIHPDPDPRDAIDHQRSAHGEIEDNLQSLRDEGAFTGLYAGIARQNSIDASRKDSESSSSSSPFSTSGYLQNISQRLAPDLCLPAARRRSSSPMMGFSPENVDSRAWMDGTPAFSPAPRGSNVEEW